MERVTTIAELRQLVGHARHAGQTVGFVPTMGALHAGHLSLIERAGSESDFVVVSIFVNPTQFGPGEDYERYPRPLEQDVELCRSAGAAAVFHPEASEVYGPEPQVSVVVQGELATLWEGASRPHHFHGVATVVAKLFNMIQPDRAFFGAKDFQQLSIIRALCRDLNFATEIVACPTLREEDGLAMSSRNAYLSSAERITALRLNHALTFTQELLAAGDLALPEILAELRDLLNNEPGLELDYATIADPETLRELTSLQKHMVILLAAKVGRTRLIDNLEVHLP